MSCPLQCERFSVYWYYLSFGGNKTSREGDQVAWTTHRLYIFTRKSDIVTFPGSCR
uniref:Uncharacterized protein n=1 Tax=Arion vulgaris TaxID=1028688 RepID=A0A0B7BBP8_9EUPU